MTYARWLRVLCHPIAYASHPWQWAGWRHGLEKAGPHVEAAVGHMQSLAKSRKQTEAEGL